MTIGYSTHGFWAPLRDLKEIEIEDRGNAWFDDSDLDPEKVEAIWVVLDLQKAPEYLSFTIGDETEEYLFLVDLTGATPVLEDEDGRVLYIREKGGEKDGFRIQHPRPLGIS